MVNNSLRKVKGLHLSDAVGKVVIHTHFKRLAVPSKSEGFTEDIVMIPWIEMSDNDKVAKEMVHKVKENTLK